MKLFRAAEHSGQGPVKCPVPGEQFSVFRNKFQKGLRTAARKSEISLGEEHLADQIQRIQYFPAFQSAIGSHIFSSLS